MFMLFIESLFYKIVETMFSNLRNSFSLISPKIHKEFVHETPQIKPSKHDSSFGTKISVYV